MPTGDVSRRRQRAFRASRLSLLVAFLIISTALGVLHQFAPATKPVSVDALDPFGGIESAISLFLTGSMLERIALSSFILLFVTIAAALVFRRVFCGMVCSFGALQELAGRLGKAVFGRRLLVPAAVDRPARFLKYVVLVGVIAWTAVSATLAIRPYDPWAAYHHLLSAELIGGFLVGLVLLAVSLVGSVLYDRFFCKYLCPMGAFLGAINRVGWFRVRRRDETCTHCLACNRACPTNVDVHAVAQVQSSECIACGLCVAACPVEGTLDFTGPRPSSRSVSPLAVLAVTLALFVAVLGASTTAGMFRWTVVPLPQRQEAGAPFVAQEIKGTDTFAQVSALSGIPQQAFLKEFGISSREFEGPIRDAAHKPGSTFDTQAVRDFVAQQMKR